MSAPTHASAAARAFARIPWAAVALVVLVAALARVAVNLDRPYLWFDEAGQFFIAKGLHHDAAPLAEPRGLAEVIEGNRHYNRDPGGFSVALHAWARVADGHRWLRALPFAMYVATIAVLVLLVHRWSRDWLGAVLAGLLPVLAGIERAMSVELRAYAMEMLGTMLALLVVDRLRERPTPLRLLAAGCVLAPFLTSRYSAVLVMFGVSLVVAWIVLASHGSPARRLAGLVAFGAPMLGTVVAVYAVSMVHQNPSARPLHYLTYLGTSPDVLLRPKNLAFLGYVAACAALLALQPRWPALRRWQALLAVTVVVNAVFVAASLLGTHPWDPFSERCISLHLLMVAAAAALAGEAVARLRARPALQAGAVAAAVAALAVAWPRLELPASRASHLDAQLRDAPLLPSTRFYVDRWEAPSVRYLFEYGRFRERPPFDYPRNFVFGTFRRHSDWAASGDAGSIPEWYRDQPKMDDLVGYDALVTPELYEYGPSDRWELLPGSDRIWVPAGTAGRDPSVPAPRPKSVLRAVP